MSNFICEHCGKVIIDTDEGYIKSCEHYPLELKQNKEGDRASIIIGDVGTDSGFGVSVPNNLNHAFFRVLELQGKNDF